MDERKGDWAMKTVWHNGKIYTMRHEGEQVEAILTFGGKVIQIGTYHTLKEEADREVNLQGAVMYPGFIDNHMHMIGHGERLRNVDLSTVHSAEEMLTVLRNAAKNLAKDEWLIGEGWDENQFEENMIPTAKQLNEVTENPIYLKRTCRHAALVNETALQLANIDDQTKNPDDGEIVRDEAGHATGYLLEGAQQLVFQLLAEPTVNQLTTSLRIAVDHLLSVGLTGAVTDDLGYYASYERPLQAFKQVVTDDNPFRARLLRRSTVFQQMMEDDITVAQPWLTLGEMKFFIDGFLGGRTALLRAPYCDALETKGIAVHTDEEIEQLVKMARAYGEAVAVHAIGDGAVEKIVHLLEKYPPSYGKRDRLIHVNVLSDELVERMLALPIVLDIQPVFVSSDFPWVMERLGKNRLDWAYAWRKLIDKGFICGAGSDAPIEDVNPLYGIYAAVTRRKIGETHSGYLPEEKLTRYEAVQLFTTGSAATIGLAHVRGKIDVGYDADFTILDRDLFTVPEEEIVQATVEMTIIAEEVRYKRK